MSDRRNGRNRGIHSKAGGPPLLDEAHGFDIAKRRQEDVGDPKPGGMQKIYEVHGLIEAHGLLDGVPVRHVRRQVGIAFRDRPVPMRISVPQFRVQPRGREKHPAARFEVMRPGAHGRNRLGVAQVMNGSLTDDGIVGRIRQGLG